MNWVAVGLAHAARRGVRVRRRRGGALRRRRPAHPGRHAANALPHEARHGPPARSCGRRLVGPDIRPRHGGALMSVRKFRDVSLMPPAPPLDTKDPATWAVIRDLWGLIARTLPPLYPPGGRRFRSIDA